MALQITGQPQGVLSVSQKSGTPSSVNTGWHNELLKSDLLPRYAYLALNGLVYSVSSPGAGQAQVAANLFSTAIATSQPIVGVFNPANSGKNVLILKAFLGITGLPTAATATGGFLWQVANNQPITQAGTVPTSHLTLKAAGSSVVGLVNQALTGATGALTVLRPVASAVPYAVQGTLAGDTPPSPIVEETVDGAIIVPPGGFAGIYNGLTGTTATFLGGLTWAELPV